MWFLVAILRSYEHLAFDRTLDKEHDIFEFFVPSELESYFVELLSKLKSHGVILQFVKLPNRLYDPYAVV
jgi:hypothetical protein